MSNTTADGTTKQFWIPEAQDNLHKKLVAKAVATVYTGPDRIVHSNYQSKPSSTDGSAATAYSVADWTTYDDTLTVNRRAVIAEHIDNIEEIQSRFDLAMARAAEHAHYVANSIDQYVFNIPVSLSGVADIDAGTMAGGASNATPYEVTSSTADDAANAIRESLLMKNARVDKGLFWVVTPRELTDITGFMQNNGFSVADAAIRNGFVGETFSGLKIFTSNNLTHSVTLTVDTQPTAGDTFTISGVVYKFVANGTAANAGEISLGGNVGATQPIIVTAINGTGTPGASTYIDVSAADRAKLKELQISAGAFGSNVTTITTKGTITDVSETFTAGTNVFGNIGRHTIAGVMGSLYVALPRAGMEFEKKSVSSKHGRELVTSQIYNSTVWTRMKDEILDVYVR